MLMNLMTFGGKYQDIFTPHVYSFTVLSNSLGQKKPRFESQDKEVGISNVKPNLDIT